VRLFDIIAVLAFKSISLFFYVVVLLCNINIVQASKPSIDYNTEVRLCYELVTKLQLDAATKKINTLKREQPTNLALIHLENYIDFFILFISENDVEYGKRIANKEIRLQKLDANKIADPYFNFIKAEILLHWALVNIKFDKKIKAGNEIYEAYKLLEANKKQYPSFIDNNKSLSVIHILAESVPKWVRKLVGVQGSSALGNSEIKLIADYSIINDNYFFREEVAAIYSYILYYQQNKKKEALLVFNNFGIDITDSPLLTFLKASIYLRNGENENCLNTLNRLKSSETSYPFYYLDFMKGRSLLYKQDSSADRYLKSFITNFKGKHFIKEAYQKLAWYDLSMNNNLDGYKENMRQCKIKGYELVDEDKQASKEAKSGKIPDVTLLKARIMFDGGYYSKTFDLLIRNEEKLSTNNAYKIEFNYRMGRVLQSLKNYAEAINYLKVAVKNSDNENYFGANAALQLGLIYEEQKDKTKAQQYYQTCLNMNPSEYKNSIHQKAKSGLIRVK
jgi:tetratricopeptide (TPR) repeat protein